MLVVLLELSGSTRVSRVTLIQRHKHYGLPQGNTLKTLWKAWRSPQRASYLQAHPSLVGNRPTQLLSFHYFSEASLFLCPSKVGIALLGANTQELPPATSPC